MVCGDIKAKTNTNLKTEDIVDVSGTAIIRSGTNKVEGTSSDSFESHEEQNANVSLLVALLASSCLGAPSP